MIKLPVGIEGWYHISVLRCGTVVQEIGPFKNLITNQGLDFIAGGGTATTGSGGANVAGVCSVGTGTTTPAFTDVNLTSFLAYASGSFYPGFPSVYSYNAGPPPYWQAITTYTFTAGTVVGNISEIGTGLYPTGGQTQPPLFSHALIVDGTGSPTTLPVTASDQLVVTYTTRLIFNTTDTAFTVNVNGVSSPGIYRLANNNNVNSFMNGFRSYGQPAITTAFFSGPLGTINSQPSSQIPSSSSTTTSSTYATGTYFQSFQSNSNVPSTTNSIQCLMITSPVGNWQFSFNTPLTWSAGQTVSINASVSWSRQ